MLDVLVLCEGQTEREFCRNVVAPYVAASSIALAGTLVGKPQRKRGGIRPWDAYRSELLRLAAQRPDRHLAVLVDYYAMPDSWPGRIDSCNKPVVERGRHVDDALRADLLNELPGQFHPCVQLHEFESLLFVEPDIAALSIAMATDAVNHVDVVAKMTAIKTQCGESVEHINDGPKTAPSKRLVQIMPAYDKVAWGVTAAADVSLDTLRAGCPWLHRWLKRLEKLTTG